MNTKKAVTIGLLTITTLGLVACAINFSKNKPKQTNAQAERTSAITQENITFTNANNNETQLVFNIITKNILNTENQTQTNKIQTGVQLQTIYNTTIGNVSQISENVKYIEFNLTNTISQIKFTFTDFQFNRLPNDEYNYEYKFNLQYLENNSIQYQYLNVTNNGDFHYVSTNYTEIENSLTAVTYTKTQITGNITLFQTPFVEIYNQGSTDGITDGYTAGETAGYTDGYTAGQTAGYTDGYTAGETAGYQEGWNDNTSLNNPIDIRGLMLNILTMPFTFIRQAFNVTMWEGTPYQFNVSNFILSLIAIATILFIIRLFTSGFSAIGNYTTSRDSRAERRSRTALNKAKTEQIKKETNK